MKSTERTFQEFIDAIHTASNTADFERVAKRFTQRLGFRWFAYLRLAEHVPVLISSYPKSWTDRYFDLGYQRLDPVLRRARREHDLFSWGGGAPKPVGNREQRRFFEEAMTFGISSGITVPIRGGFGRMAAFTLATDEPLARTDRLLEDARAVVQLAGLYFHTHATTKLNDSAGPPAEQSPDPARTTVPDMGCDGKDRGRYCSPCRNCAPHRGVSPGKRAPQTQRRVDRSMRRRSAASGAAFPILRSHLDSDPERRRDRISHA